MAYQFNLLERIIYIKSYNGSPIIIVPYIRVKKYKGELKHEQII
jgi:hypothetical protein